MKVLIASTSVPEPPLLDGYSLQLHHLLAGLTDREIRLVAIGQPAGHRLPPHVGLRVVPGRRRGPISPGRHARLLAEPLTEELGDYHPDVVHIAGNSLAALAAVAEGRVPMVLAALDAPFLNAGAGTGAGVTRLRRLIKAAWSRRSVRSFHHRFDRVVVVSEDDGRALREIDGRIRTVVIPNGVDSAAYAAESPARRNEGELLFTGALGYGPNEDAAVFLAREIFPLISQVRPGVTLRLVGRAPSPTVLALGELAGVTVVGEVPDMRPELSRAAIYVCPMVSGTGIKNKLLEAMANGLACVATPLATRGLSVAPGRHLMVGDTAVAIADAVIGLLDDPERRRRVGREAAAFVRDNHSWERVARSYATLYDELTKTGS